MVQYSNFSTDYKLSKGRMFPENEDLTEHALCDRIESFIRLPLDDLNIKPKFLFITKKIILGQGYLIVLRYLN